MQTCPHCGFVNINERTTCTQCHQSFTVIPPGGLPIAQSTATPPDPVPAPAPTPATTGPTAVLPKKTALWLKIAGGIGAFVVGCCVLLIIIGLLNPSDSDTEAAEPTAAPRATEVDPPMPSPTMVPTDTPRPTRAPAPTRTPRPTPTEAPAQAEPTEEPDDAPAEAQGMGVSRRAIQQAFEALDFNFEPSTDVRGQPRVMAQHDIAIVEIIGPASDVTQAAVLLIVPPQDTDAAMRGLVYWGVLLGIVAPDQNLGPWVIDQVEAATPGARRGESYEGETVRGGYRVKFSSLPMDTGIMMTLTLAVE